jgi:urease accessory protein UreH
VIAPPLPAERTGASGTLRIAASRRGERTVVDTLRYDGLIRCSRPFADPDGSARLVVAHLGPGFVRGDRFAVSGELGCGATLHLESQSATRALGEGDASHIETRWQIGDGATLVSAAEPTVAYAGASHHARATVTLARGASLAWLDAVVPYGRFERFETSLRVFFGERLALHDALRLTPQRLGAGVVSACFVREGMSAPRSAALVAAADAAGSRLAGDGDIAIGIGTPAVGGVIVRARGPRVREIRAALVAMLTELRRIDAPEDAPFV